MDLESGDRRWDRKLRAGVGAAIAFVSLVWIGLAASPAAAAPCGAPGQRACCNGASEFSNCGTACDVGAVIASGCSGDCNCGGSIFTTGDHCDAISPACGGDGERGCCVGESCRPCGPGLTEVTGCSGSCSCSNSHCRQATHCGGNGERACCGGELVHGVQSCDDDLVEVGGCSGDCFCGGTANPGAINSSGHCFAPSHCGGDGERACCTGTFEFSNDTDLTPVARLCDSGFQPIPGCVGDCQCGGTTAVGGVNSFDTCVKVSACGGENQRACCLSERINPCDTDLQEIPGCTGDCYCRGGTASGTCAKLESGKLPKSPQPGTGRATPPTAPRVCKLRGYADLHVHMFADVAHGGSVLSGAAYDPTNDDVNAALRPDYGTDRDLVTNTGAEVPTPTCPSFISDCGANLFHGDHTLFDDPVGLGTGDDTHSNLGAPLFNGWPTWHTTTHQQVYYKWLERAYQGGLRLISMLAVTNEALCLGNKHVRNTDCADSMAAIDVQLDDAVAFEQFIDAKSGGTGMGWFRIVRTPAEARRVIADGKLAVVLGIEVDNLFNCHWANRNDPTGDCSPEGIRAKVTEYFDRGVRHVFPIHNFNNAFGGPATWQDAIDVGNRASEKHWWSYSDETGTTQSILDCSAEGYGFKLSCFMQSVIQLLGFPDSVVPLTDPVPCYDTASATCNPLGLTQSGRVLVQALIDNGMIIDVDHMSNEAIADTLALAGAANHPVVASHVQFFDLNESTQRHERMRTRAQLDAIRNGGGMVAAMLKDDVQDGLGGKTKKVNLSYTTSPSGVSIADNCRHSTKTFAQALQYAIDVMGRPVALGSDFNGVAGHVGPRFGPDACGGVADEKLPEYRSLNRLQYPFDLGNIGEPGFGTFDEQVTGGKTFDFNVDGLAHIGLLPDLVADLAQVGLPASYLDQLFDSAEEFIRVWEKSAGEPEGTPTCIIGCGNDQVDAGEECDGAVLNGNTCQSFGYVAGTLACDASCHFDVSACLTQVCGNGAREGTEGCDAGAANGQPGSCCGAECVPAADDAPCATDDNECTADVCRGAACAHPPLADGAPCTEGDGNDCTTAGCEQAQCNQTHLVAPDGAACATDQDECTSDVCGGGACTHPDLPRAPTFLSIDCRLEALRAAVQSTTTGRVQISLLRSLEKAITQKQNAEAAAAAGNRPRARSGLRSALRRMTSFAHRVNSLAGRKMILPQPVATELLAQQQGIATDMQTLMATFQ